jgi:DHA1 family multidrug resistance protein-like MFS transporter
VDPARPTLALTLVYTSTATLWASYAMMAVVLPFRFQALGLSVTQYGLALAALAFGMLMTESIWGVLAFRLANVRTILILGSAVGLIFVAIGFSTSFLELAALLGLYGALGIFQVPLMRWMALTARGPGTGGRGTGIYGLFSGGGLVIGTAIGPLLYLPFGFVGLQLVVAASYAVAVGLTVILPWAQVRLPPRQPGFLRHLRELSTRPFAIVATLVICAFISKSLVLNFLQYYSVALFHGTVSESGYVIAFAQGTSLVAGAALGVLVDRWGPGRSTPAGFLLVTLGAVGTLLSADYSEMVLATITLAAGIGWLAASLLPLALGPIPLRGQGTAIGVFGSFEDLGLLIGPILISASYAAYGPRSIFSVVGLVALLGLLTSLVLRPRGGEMVPGAPTTSAGPS